jgi:hypothetical protein
MTLGNMRANGVRSIAVRCLGRACHHEAIINVDRWPDEVEVPSIGQRRVCTRCGLIGADAQTNWNERQRGSTGPIASLGFWTGCGRCG